MRMSSTGPTAADVVNEEPEQSLARIIRDYGEERRARRVARAIVQARRETRIERTGALAGIVRRAVGQAGGGGGREPDRPGHAAPSRPFAST